jgi:hypothetical protein
MDQERGADYSNDAKGVGIEPAWDADPAMAEECDLSQGQQDDEEDELDDSEVSA